jgi:hypothetical protein
LVSVRSGGIYFQEFNYMTASMWVGFTGGICVIFSGLYFLAPAPNPATSAHDFQMELNDIAYRRTSQKALAEESSSDDSPRSGVSGGTGGGAPKPRSFAAGSQDPHAQQWRRGQSAPFNAADSDALSLDLNVIMASLYNTVRSGVEAAASADGQRRATFLFMSGAAQLNHHENSLRLLKARKEQELMRLVSSKHGLTKEETEKVAYAARPHT